MPLMPFMQIHSPLTTELNVAVPAGKMACVVVPACASRSFNEKNAKNTKKHKKSEKKIWLVRW